MQSKKLLFPVCVTLVVLGSMISVVPVKASGNTWHVGGGPPLWQQPDIQTAVNVATTNDRIIVHAGTYNEHVVIPGTKSDIKIIGDGAILDGVSCTLMYSFELIGADYISIQGFTITHYGDAGIYIHSDDSGWPIRDPATKNMIRNNTIEYNCGSGVIIGASHYNTIQSNLVHDNARIGVFIDDGYKNVIRNNGIYRNIWTGIELHIASYTTVRNNDVWGNHANGLYADGYSGYTDISSNAIVNNYICGIFVLNAAYIMIKNNTASFNGYDGILIRGADYTCITGNYAMNNAHDGICVMYDPETWDIAEWNCICYNTVLNNWYDLVFGVPPGMWQSNWYNNHWDFNTYNVAAVGYWPPQPWNPPPCPPGCWCPCC